MMNYAPSRQSAVTVLAVGAVTGLLLGLLIGWVIWPVEWTGATLRDLDDSQKAEYIAAVADAFVIYDSPEAAEVAQRRLAALDDGNLDQSFNAALQYFSASQFSDKAIRDSNIRRLAVALNMSPPTVAVAPVALPTTNADSAAAPTLEALAPTPTTTEATGRLGWVGWLLWFLTAVILLGGGIYILTRAGLPALPSLLKLRTAAPKRPVDEIDEFPLIDQPQNQTTPGAPGKAGIDYSFDEEDDYRPPTAQSPRLVSPSTNESYTRRPAATVYSKDDDLAAEDEIDDDFVDDDFVDEPESDPAFAEDAFDDEDDTTGPWRPTGRSYSIDITQDTGTLPVTPIGGRNQAQPKEETAAPSKGLEPESPRADARTLPAGRDKQTPPQAESKRSERPTPATRARARVIDQHVFHYQIGMAEYEASRPIVDPQSKRYVGEFGMSTGGKGGSLQTGTDQPVALEVWLFDKADERNVGSQTRILLSEYAVDHNLEPMFLKERQDNPRPFTAQPGVHFQLESQSFLLDCTIVEVEYSTNSTNKGVFQKITVDTTVQQKG